MSFYFKRNLTSLTFSCPASHKHHDRCLQVSPGGDGENKIPALSPRHAAWALLGLGRVVELGSVLCAL